MNPVTLTRLVLLSVVAALALAVPASASAAAIDDSKTVNEDAAPEVIEVLANDNQPDPPPTTARLQTVTVPSHGVATIERGTPDQITYKPSANYCGADSFSYSGDYGMADVSVTVTCVDDPPLANNDPTTGGYHVDEDSGPVDYDVLANDTDIDGGPKLITAFGQAERGTATLVGTKVRYAPTANLCGASVIRYTLNDSLFLAQKAALTVDADCKPDLPVANSDAFAVGFGAGTTFLPVVANDTDADDLNETPSQHADIPIIGVTQPVNGSATIVQGVANRTDQIAYTPRAGFCGTDSFAYRVLRDEVPLGQVTVTVACPLPATIGVAPPAPAVVKRSAKAGAPKVGGTALTVPLTCTATTSCSMALGLTSDTAAASGKRKRAKAVSYGKAKLTLKPGQKRTATVKLNAAGKRALKKKRKLKARLTVTLGGKKLASRTVTFKAKRSKKR